MARSNHDKIRKWVLETLGDAPTKFMELLTKNEKKSKTILNLTMFIKNINVYFTLNTLDLL